ncbi:MAG: hypothetical protein EOP83_11350, partial [Verrucomicrobiaceae bacterium]
PQDILARLGITTERRRAEDLSSLFDGDLAGYYYVAAACKDHDDDEAIKWIMGGLAQGLNERGIPFSEVSRVMPADYLNAFARKVSTGFIDRSVAKDVFAALLDVEKFETGFGTEWIDEFPKEWSGLPYYLNKRQTRVHEVSKALADGADLKAIQCGEGSDLTLEMVQQGEAYLVARDEIGWVKTKRIPGDDAVVMLANQSRFVVSSGDDVTALVDQVLAANPAKVAEAQAKPQLAQWFVGQVMKAAKGQKLPAPLVLATIKEKLGVE